MTITFVGLVALFLVAVALFARLKPAGLPPHMAKRINMVTIGAVVFRSEYRKPISRVDALKIPQWAAGAAVRGRQNQ